MVATSHVYSGKREILLTFHNERLCNCGFSQLCMENTWGGMSISGEYRDFPSHLSFLSKQYKSYLYNVYSVWNSANTPEVI